MYEIKASIKETLDLLANLKEQVESGEIEQIMIIVRTRLGEVKVGCRGEPVLLAGMLEVAKFDVLSEAG